MRQPPFAPWLRLERLAPTLSVGLLAMMILCKVTIYEVNDEVAAALLLKQAPQHLLKGYFIGWDYLLGGLYQLSPDVPWMDVLCAALSLATAGLLAFTLAQAVSDAVGQDQLRVWLAAICIAGLCLTALSVVNLSRFAILLPSLIWLQTARVSLRRGLALTLIAVLITLLRPQFAIIGLVFTFGLTLLLAWVNTKSVFHFSKQQVIFISIPIIFCVGILSYDDSRYKSAQTDLFDASVQVWDYDRCANVTIKDPSVQLIIESYQSFMVYDTHVAMKHALDECPKPRNLFSRLTTDKWIESRSLLQALFLQVVPIFILLLSLVSIRQNMIYIFLFSILMLGIHTVLLLFAKSEPRFLLPIGVLLMTVVLRNHRYSNLPTQPKNIIFGLLILTSGFLVTKQLALYIRNTQYAPNNFTLTFDRPVIFSRGAIQLTNFKRLFDAPPIEAPQITFIYGWPARMSNLNTLNCQSQQARGESVDCTPYANDLHALFATAEQQQHMVLGGTVEQDLLKRYVRHFYQADLSFHATGAVSNRVGPIKDLHTWRVEVKPAGPAAAEGAKVK